MSSFCTRALGSSVVAGSGLDVILYNNTSATPIWIDNPSINQVGDIKISSDGNYIISEDYHTIRFYHRSSSNRLWNYDAGESMWSLAISENGNYSVAGTASLTDTGKIIFFNKTDFLWEYQTNGYIEDVVISTDGNFIAGVSRDNYLYFLNKSGSSLWNGSLGVTEVCAATMTPDAEYIVASSDSNVYLFNSSITDPKLPLWSKNVGGWVNSLDITDNGEYIVSGGKNKKVHLFSKSSPEPIFEFSVESSIRSVAISPNGKYFAAATNDYIYLFHNETTTNSFYNRLILSENSGDSDREKNKSETISFGYYFLVLIIGAIFYLTIKTNKKKI